MPLEVPGARHRGSPEMGNRVEIKMREIQFNLNLSEATNHFFYKQSHTKIGYTYTKKISHHLSEIQT